MELHAVLNDNGTHFGVPQQVLTKHTEVDDGQEVQAAYELQLKSDEQKPVPFDILKQ